MSIQPSTPAEDLEFFMHVVYDAGLTTLSGGNLSIRDADGLWITPSGTDKSRLQIEDIVYLRRDGTHEGRHRPSIENPFHWAIYDARSDLHAVVHAHPPALVAYSLARSTPPLDILPEFRKLIGCVGYAPYAMPGSADLGANIADAFAAGCNTVLMENHGVVTAGTTISEAYHRLEALDFCARLTLRAFLLRLDGPHMLTESVVRDYLAARSAYEAYSDDRQIDIYMTAREHVSELNERVWHLERAAMSILSARGDDRAFIATPWVPTSVEMWPPQSLEEMQIDSPSSYAAHRVHAAIYARHPQIGAVINAQPLNATVYAITHTHIDTRTIPESWVMLRDVPLISFATFVSNPEAIAAIVTPSAPVALIKNFGAITIGRTPLEAYDRLEILEFTARSLIDVQALGDLQPMSEEALEGLKRAFGL